MNASALPWTIFTFDRRRAIKRASITSDARSERGKTRFPRSIFNGTPNASKKDMTSSGGNCVSALVRKRGFRGMFAIHSCTELALVRLHRPFPVIYIFRPNLGFRSSKVTLAPDWAAKRAAIHPAAPPPITTISVSIPPPPCRIPIIAGFFRKSNYF